GAVTLASLLTLWHHIGPSPDRSLLRRAGEHLRFGARGFMSGIFELFARVDILIVGVFATDSVVGAFAFAATPFEGLYQVLYVLRINYAPIVVRLWTGGQKAELEQVIRRGRNRTYAGAAMAGALAIAGYVVLVPVVTADAALIGSWQAFAVLVAGAVAGAGYNPFLPLLLYAGLPGRNTVFMLVVFTVNLAGNLALVPTAGAIGSALATAAALVSSALILRALAARQLGLRI